MPLFELSSLHAVIRAMGGLCYSVAAVWILNASGWAVVACRCVRIFQRHPGGVLAELRTLLTCLVILNHLENLMILVRCENVHLEVFFLTRLMASHSNL
ncbi:hypothetical protein Sjap_005187 [Stephania japonica]|uniref:Uncharacterized protein n=1 Tax=Stephania japonica TaxID=461633 RepID=A0AAP0PJT8_9MAGN